MRHWYLLPGMGATSKMYAPLERCLTFKINFLNWPDYKSELSFKDMAIRIIEENGLDESDIIGGSSLGGMIALEIGTILNSKAIVLIGSAINKKEINQFLTTLAPIAEIMPFSFLTGLSSNINHVISHMFSTAHPDFLRTMCRYCRVWNGYQGDLNKIFRIHGKKDGIITCPSYGSNVIEDARHLIAMTHPVECALFLQRISALHIKDINKKQENKVTLR